MQKKRFLVFHEGGLMKLFFLNVQKKKQTQLSKNRRVTISEYKGKRMVHIREYYSKDDKMLPGKKVYFYY